MKKAILFLLIFSVGALLFAQQKHALVIGNARYTGISTLTNPVNDANDMETALRNLGFTVEKVLNGNLEQMEIAIMNLKRRLSGSPNSYGFFFYAGHGVQANGENYLIPVTADNIRNETHLRDRAVSLQFVLDSLSEADNELNMIVLDACRDNPFGWSRSGSRGLSVASRAPSGSIVMYATGANSTASDGTGRNGLFTGHLLNNLRTQGLNVFEVFNGTMRDVLRVTNGSQHPEISLRYADADRAYLGTRPSPSPTPSPTPAPSPSPQPAPANMVRIQGGTFMMGSPSNEPSRDYDEVQHQVTVSSFYMGRYQVTQAEYEAVMGTNPSNFRGANLPVENVIWYEAIVFCNKLSMREGLSPAYSINGSTDPARWGTAPTSNNATWNAVVIVANSNGYRLPTEAQWEYACRAGTTTPFSTGNNITTAQANYDGNYPYNNNAGGESRQRTTPVGSFAPNAYGLYDMHGNVWEMCWDRYGDYSTVAQTDPQGAVSGDYRVSRGGSWNLYGRHLRSAFRDFDNPYDRLDNIGFRLVRP